MEPAILKVVEILRIIESGELCESSKFLIKSGGFQNVDFRVEGLPTALFIEILERNFYTAEMLVDAGADTNIEYFVHNTGITYTPYTLLMRIWCEMDQNPNQDDTREHAVALLKKMNRDQDQEGGAAEMDQDTAEECDADTESVLIALSDESGMGDIIPAGACYDASE
jgi:hypothetical protein